MQTISDFFNFYKNAPSDIYMHMDTLKEYASECEHITEMGVRGVVSTWAFLSGNPKRLVSIDIVDCPIHDASLLAHQAGIDFKFIKADTRSPALDIEETDLLFIDTLHQYEQLKTEFNLHSHKAKKYIILHDTTTFGTVGENSGSHAFIKGLWFAVEEFLKDNSDWKLKDRFVHNNGLTILERVTHG